MNTGVLAAGLSSFFIIMGTVIASAVTKTIHPLVLIVLAYGVSMLFYLIFFLRGDLHVRKLLREFPLDTIKVIILRSVIGQILIVYGFSLTLAIRAVFMTRLEPLFVFMFSVLLIGERIRRRKVALLFVLIFGAFLISTGGDLSAFSSLMLGDLLIAFSLIFLAYSYIPSSRIMKKINTQTLTAFSNFIAMLITIPIALLLLPISAFQVSLNSWVLIILYALFFYFLGLMLWFKAFEKAKPWVIASMLALAPIWGSLVSFFWLGQTLSLIQLLGGAIIILTTLAIIREKQ